jgi:hypothetical protein
MDGSYILPTLAGTVACDKQMHRVKYRVYPTCTKCVHVLLVF